MTYTSLSSEDLEENWLWLASDSLEQIGCFETFGHGALPLVLRASIDLADRIDEFTATLLDNPKRCDANVCSDAIESILRVSQNMFTQGVIRDKFVSGVRRVAQSGMFVFHPVAEIVGPSLYRRVAIPDRPLFLSDLPLEIREVVFQINLCRNFSEDCRIVKPDHTVFAESA